MWKNKNYTKGSVSYVRNVVMFVFIYLFVCFYCEKNIGTWTRLESLVDLFWPLGFMFDTSAVCLSCDILYETN